MRRRLKNLVAVILAGLWGAFIWTAHAQGHLAFLDRVEAAVTDFRTILRGVKPPPDEVTIVEIDDALVKQAGSFPLPRRELGRLVQAITQLRPRVIALDILLLDKGSDEGDDALAEALGAGPTVIAAAALFPESRQSIDAANSDDPIASLPQSREVSSAIEEVFRPCAGRHRQLGSNRSNRHTAFDADAVPDQRRRRDVASTACRRTGHRQQAHHRAVSADRGPALGSDR